MKAYINVSSAIPELDLSIVSSSDGFLFYHRCKNLFQYHSLVIEGGEYQLTIHLNASSHHSAPCF